MAESVTHFLQEYLSPELVVFFISMLPVLELRGGLIASVLLGVPWYIAAPLCILGNAIPVPFIIFFIERILGYLKDHGPIQKFARAIEARAMRKGAEMMEKYPHRVQLGLLAFVGIPLPVTGAWTGSLIAALLGISPKRSFPAIFAGIGCACVIMLVLTYLIPGLFGFTVS